ncbi:large subunit ribosomal protein L25 [Salirhabdus euzebyi]|uniref:Large ribosomal subunit protein bL25 n=1 Tax=Salirhabdus euzebyi TaxID=394506 RepID=A0A841QA47_9BACI|nr:50S ribosomal protein L25/general stress protein Ctc [Salirhabdus euzebyi]MBB6455245.1 large subunit ribosomal protein L25 [Salirhabdus euzebyi]
MAATIKANGRDDLRRSATRELRIEGSIPAVVYGNGKTPITIAVDSMELLKMVRDHGKNAVFSLDIEGQGTVNAMLYDYQADPLKGELVHADFYQVDMSSNVDVEVAIHLEGDATEKGSVVQQTLHQLNVRAKPNAIPENISVNIEELGIGDSVTVGDLKGSSNYEILDDDDTTIVTILPPQNEKADEEEEATESEETPTETTDDEEKE